MFVNLAEQGNQSSSEAGEAEEGFGEFVITGSDATEVFDPLEEVLDQMTLAVADLAEAGRSLSIPAWRDAWLDTALDQPLTEGVATMAAGISSSTA